MQVYPFWARARCDLDGQAMPDGPVHGVGWSQHSEADAQRHAMERARQIARRLKSGDASPGGGYYADRPLREPVLDEVRGPDGQLVAMLTRNAYGACVLNAARTMFIDIDRPEPARPGLLARLFGRRPEPMRDEIPERVEALAASRPDLGLRLYQTAGGYRAIVTSRPLDPESDEAMDLLERLGADPLYVRLCRSQSCFRARLTPKPWRCGMGRPPGAYPRVDESARQAFEVWASRYDRASQGFAVCRLGDSFGPASVHPEVASVVDWHDRVACGEGPLA